MLKAINGLYVKLVSYVPIRGSSYLALPSDLQSMNCLLNIRNREDKNCFLYCSVAAWHFIYAQSLYENVGWRMRTNPETYSPSNPMTHQPVGDFEMPILPLLLFRFTCEIQEKSLPSIEKWTNSFQDGYVSITPGNLNMQNFFWKLGCENLGSYHDLYLTTDTLLLACVVEHFRKVTYSTYGLDSAYYYTCSHVSGDVFLKVIKARVELLTDRSHLEMAENMIRGGVSLVFSKYLATVNKYLKRFDGTKARTYGFLVDAKNLSGGIMQKFSAFQRVWDRGCWT